MHTTSRRQEVRPLPAILYHGNFIKVATREGRDTYRELRAEGMTHAEADRFIYDPAAKNFFWTAEPPAVIARG